MILGNRRLRLLYIALAGMDMAAFLPWLTIVIIFWSRNGDTRSTILATLLTQNPLLLFIVFWATMQLYMLIADLFSRWNIQGGLYAVAILGVLTLTSLLAVRLLLYPDAVPSDFRWLRETIYALVNLLAGVRGEILLILTNYFLWMRVARYTNRSISFFGVGVSFRLGMLIVVLGSTLLSYWNGQNSAAILYMVLFFAFGLSAVAVARIDQKAIGSANSSGARLPWDRFAQLWAIIIAILGTSLAAATLYTPPILRAILGWFAPVGRLLQWLVTNIVYLVFLLLTPLLEWLTARIQAMIAQARPLPPQQPTATPPPLTLGDAVQDFAMLHYCVAAAIIFGAILLFLIFFVRVTQRQRASEPEDTATEGGVRPGGINLGLGRLKDWFALLGRYGLGSQLLAAISVENIYANLSRLARRKGFARLPSQGPDHYLPTLMQAFPGHEAELTTITNAYMRVRYAERPITQEELEHLRAAYTTITTSSDTASPEDDGQARAAT
jgi:hypothetical protein